MGGENRVQRSTGSDHECRRADYRKSDPNRNAQKRSRDRYAIVIELNLGIANI
jgi:hypothetical protein